MIALGLKKSIIKKIILFSVIIGAIIALFIPTTVFAQKPIDPCQQLGSCIKGVDTIGQKGIRDGTTELVLSVVRILIWVGAAVAVLYIVLGGYTMITSQGDSSKYTKGLETLRNAVLGLIIAIISVTIVSFVSNIVINTDVTSKPATTTTTTS